MPLTAATRGWLRVGCAVAGAVLFAALVVSHWNGLDEAADDRLYGYAEGSVERLWIREQWKSNKNKTKLLVPTIVYSYSVNGHDYTGTTWLKPGQNADEFNSNSNAEWAARISTYLTRYTPGLDAARRPLSSAPAPAAYPLLALPYERGADDAAPPILVKYRSAQPVQSAVFFHPLLVDLVGAVVLAHLVAAAASAGVLLLRDNAAERNRHPVASNADGSATLYSSALTSGDIWPICLTVAGLSAVALPLLYGPFFAAYPPGVASPLRFGLAPALLVESVAVPLLVAAAGVYYLLRWLWMREPVLTVRTAHGRSFRVGDALVVAVSQRLQRTLTVQSLTLTVACHDRYTSRRRNGKSEVKTTVVSSATRSASAWSNRVVPAGHSVDATFDDVQIPDPGAPARGVYSWSISYTLSVAHAPDYSAVYPIFPLMAESKSKKK